LSPISAATSSAIRCIAGRHFGGFGLGLDFVSILTFRLSTVAISWPTCFGSVSPVDGLATVGGVLLLSAHLQRQNPGPYELNSLVRWTDIVRIDYLPVRAIPVLTAAAITLKGGAMLAVASIPARAIFPSATASSLVAYFFTHDIAFW